MANKIILLILSALLLKFCSCESKINLTVAGWSLASNHTITSPNGSFTLGFFSISNRFYAGIWYAKMQNKTNIWIANRNNPASLNASLQFSGNGDLTVMEPNGTVIWSAGTAGKNVSILALEEVGNLILYDRNSGTAWQSFDHPTDTWVVGTKMYYGYNITCWQATDEPAAGRYSLKIFQDSSYRSLWNGSVEYWSSGIWSGNTFVRIPELTQGYIYKMALYKSQSSNGMPYFIWSEKNSSAHHYSHLTIEPDGVIRVRSRVPNDAWFVVWQQPKDACDVEKMCGQFGICNMAESPACSCPSGFIPVDYNGWMQLDWSQGCVLNQSLSCSETSDFVTLSQTSYQTNSSSVVGLQISASSCKNRCLQNCSCVAYSYDKSGFGQCYLYGENNAAYNGKTSSKIFSTSYLKIAGTKSKSRSKRGIILGVSVGCGILFLSSLLLGFIILLQRWRRKLAYVSGELHTFTYRDLKSATWNFKQTLGDGGFGTVYKGELYDKSLVAVKMLKKREDYQHGEKGFRAEISTIGKIQHKNLVCLRGYCAENGHRLLVYECVEGGSLNRYLFSEDKLLDWITRFNIALGTARALAYLHEECKDCIIHCDIKPENILLDKDLCPKVSDFGLAKLMGRNFSRVLTSMKGTLGYLAPEWLSGMPITPKADVFSYGMTLLEILCGRRNIKLQEHADKIFFPFWVINQMKAGNAEAVIDPRLQGSFDRVQAVMLLRLAIWCIQDEESERPSMGRVVQMLEGSVQVEEPPVPKSYLMFDI